MDNVQILNSRAFARDGELEQEIIAMKDGTHQPLGVILISPNCVCLQCGGKLLARRDCFSKVTLYTESMGTVPAKHFHKYCQRAAHLLSTMDITVSMMHRVFSTITTGQNFSILSPVRKQLLNCQCCTSLMLSF